MESETHLENQTFNMGFPVFLLIVILSVLVMLPFMPPQPLLNRDSGSFLYMGQQVLHGKTPYLDFWDHKGPLIFYIEALGLGLANGNRFGVWLLECFSLSTAGVIGYLLIKKNFSAQVALWGVFALIYAFGAMIVGGNFTEEYSLPFNLLSILLFYQYLKSRWKMHLLFIGAILSFNLLLRPNNAALQVVILLVIFLTGLYSRKIAQTIGKLFWVFLGSLLVLVPVCFYLFTKGVLVDSIYAAFIFNLNYVGDPAFSKLSVLVFFILASGWPCWFAFVGYGMLLWDLKRRVFPMPVEVMLVVLIGFPLEMLLSTLGGRPYLHYALVFLPYIAILNAFLLHSFLLFAKTSSDRLKKFSLALVVIITLGASLWINMEFYKRLYQAGSNLSEQSVLVRYIRNHTNPTDTILVWTEEPSIYFLSEREAPTRFYAPSLFLIENFATQQNKDEFLSDLRRKRPVLLLDANNFVFPDLAPAASLNVLQYPQFLDGFIASLRQYMRENYQKVTTIEGWDVYSIKDN